MPLYKCQDPDCEECQKAFGGKAMTEPSAALKLCTICGGPFCGADDDALRSPADLAEVLENVRAGIEILQGDREFRHGNCTIPIELHKACQALTHMTKDAR